ncbi:hypothetical protein GTA62_19475 [Roseobacter sp. HKCCD9010]|uniref:hypothetical protein n=1 Tax=unclassified Roseobacter TaxID=196798 RepID=UPI0014929667|nr:MULTISPECIES: hypothetical protein [unclassified Roseobacter]MBF9052167.1 hypothetical protein [Rhodobacterales bacterium HKCCD4356]NNV14122.1 hypothetical protein [Roseobacter sp. HKCCD7357]NNV18327.1 hypothetical protein [Roseobacter sp. HKCCD8768]NNV27786.1 hypothetical protein [Roseobacter sp. HKCCD8192]NNV32061.1 hypothetical protein [Roseobacter sp. HKCCD9061]
MPKRDLKSIIARAVAAARSWNELAAALAENNVMLAAKGGGLVVKNASTSEEISKISALGFKYVDLIRHFGEGFPDHHATWLVEKTLNDNYVPKSPKRTGKARNRRNKPSGDED